MRFQKKSGNLGGGGDNGAGIDHVRQNVKKTDVATITVKRGLLIPVVRKGNGEVVKILGK